MKKTSRSENRHGAPCGKGAISPIVPTAVDCRGSRRRGSDRSVSVRLPEELGRSFRDHDRRRVGVTADDRRHDRRVDDSKAVDTVHLQVWIDDRAPGIRTHATRSHRVVDGLRSLAHELPELVVCPGGVSRPQLSVDGTRERRRAAGSRARGGHPRSRRGDHCRSGRLSSAARCVAQQTGQPT